MAFYCNGKKNFCTESECKDTDCEYYNGEGGEYEPDLVMLKTNAYKHELVKLKTNADRIRAMNDEELAEFLVHFSNGVKRWLKQPAE